MQVGVDIAQDVLMAFPGIAEDFADGEVGEAAAQVLEARDGEQVIVAVGRGEGAGDRPEGEEAVIHDVEGFGLVAEVVLAVGERSAGLGSLDWSIGVVAGLVGAGVVDVGGLGIAEGGETAVLAAGRRVTGAAFLAGFACRAGARGGQAREQAGTWWRQRMWERDSISWQSVEMETPRSGGSSGKVEWVGISP